MKTLVAVVLLALLSLCGFPALAADYQVSRNLYYGDETRPDRELQSLDVYWQDNLKPRPVIVYVHGGGWAFGDKSEVNHKPEFFVPAGFAFVSMNYRLRWDYKLYDQLEDIVSVVNWVRKHAAKYGFDHRRVVLMGHEAGAHLVSLVGTNPSFMKAGGLKLSDLSAVVSIDTMSYDIPRVMSEFGSFVQRRQHNLVFSESASAQRAASPVTHVGAKDTPPFALLYASNTEASHLQAEGFARALTGSGVNAIMIPGNAKTPQMIDVELGMKGDITTAALMAFIRASL